MSFEQATFTRIPALVLIGCAATVLGACRPTTQVVEMRNDASLEVLIDGVTQDAKIDGASQSLFTLPATGNWMINFRAGDFVAFLANAEPLSPGGREPAGMESIHSLYDAGVSRSLARVQSRLTNTGTGNSYENASGSFTMKSERAGEKSDACILLKLEVKASFARPDAAPHIVEAHGRSSMCRENQ